MILLNLPTSFWENVLNPTEHRSPLTPLSANPKMHSRTFVSCLLKFFARDIATFVYEFTDI